MNVLARAREPQSPCAYLADRDALLDLFLCADVRPDELGELLARGHRHFGPVYFRPDCAACEECIAVRIALARFEPTRSQRRAARLAGALRREVAAARVDEERLSLYAKWHGARETARGWEPSSLDAASYAREFAQRSATAREVTFRDDAAGGRLVGVGHWDETSDACSAVYFFHDPDYARFSLGTANVVSYALDARRRGLAWLYLGYLVRGCASLAYKARFSPLERLVGRPRLDETPRWVALERASRGVPE